MCRGLTCDLNQAGSKNTSLIGPGWVPFRLALLPGENMAGARPAMASCLFLAKSEILHTKTPSKVVADISLSRPSISATVRSFSPTVRSSCRTWKTRHMPSFNKIIEARRLLFSEQVVVLRNTLSMQVLRRHSQISAVLMPK